MKLVTFLLFTSLTALCSGEASHQAERGVVRSQDEAAKAVIASKGEPGEPLIVTGKVYAADGATPLAGATVYVYQTDARGYYGANESRDSTSPRLRATMRTDAEGRYEFQTIKPGSYPGTKNPAHIHYVVSAPGHKEKVFEIIFQDDPNVTDRIRADAAREESAYSIKRLDKDRQGVMRCMQDVMLRRE
jgi:protocatechuate 3,4-dioxygenase beta subunit